MKFPRASGILLHPTSLPGRFGIGDFGAEAFEFVDFLADAKQTYWQILPLNPTGYGDSPYQCFSVFAGNTLLISPGELLEDGLLSKQDLEEKPDFTGDKVDYGRVFDWKEKILAAAFQNFSEKPEPNFQREFEVFQQHNWFWLDDYALYRALRKNRSQKSWLEWEESLRFRDETALQNARQEFSEEIMAQKFYQFLFFRQWVALKNYAGEKGIKFIGDVPIFVSFDSADVWCNQSKFKLNEDGSPRVVAGVPPDYFSKTGQLWGNPVYDWERMKQSGFQWWQARIWFNLQMFDLLRIDHFRGFAATWEVPAGDETAENGQWVNAPGKELFWSLKNAFGELPFIAEDLGDITPDVIELRETFGFPGMKILQFAFGGGAENGYLSHNYEKNFAAYTGNHDNNTIVGWFDSANKHEKKFCQKYLACKRKDINWNFIRAIWQSVADTAIVPLQDVLGLGKEARMNFPSSSLGNWQWRFEKERLTKEINEKLRELTEVYGR